MECIVYCWVAMRQTALPIVKGALNMRMKVNQRVSQDISKLDFKMGLLDLFQHLRHMGNGCNHVSSLNTSYLLL